MLGFSDLVGIDLGRVVALVYARVTAKAAVEEIRMRARARSSLVPVIYLLIAAGVLLLGGCLKRKLKPLNPCLVSGVVAEIAVTNIDKVDLLFMVDNSGSMREEQEALRREFPKLVTVLTTGTRADGTKFPPAKDLHLGVVSSDMGLAGIRGIDKCNDAGDDGIMRNTPSPDVNDCMPPYPRFLSYTAGEDDPVRTSTDFACIASLGTGGCGFEQQLESVLKALWPSVDIDPETMEPFPMPRIEFRSNTGSTLGHGDTANLGFLRNDETLGLSLIAIIVVSDEEDCSSRDTSHFEPRPPAGSPLLSQDLNLRCFRNKQNLYELTRYINGYKALRAGNPNLVIFGAIVGVPQDLVQPEDYANVDWGNDDARNQFYKTILDHPRMQEVPDPSLPPMQGNLTPSCTNAESVAYPPRRIVEVAQGFGANGTVHSICEPNFGPAVDAIIDVIAKQLGAVCLPRALVRNSEGLVGCNVVWELPTPAMANPAVTPTSCGAPNFEFLLPPDEGRDRTTDQGGAVCKVAQLKVIDDATAVGGKRFEPTENNGTVFSSGWYYDDFSEEVTTECTGMSKQRVAFTPGATPPTGVTVKLECLNETQSLAQNRVDIAPNYEQPKIGDPCEMVMRNGEILMGNQACLVRLVDGSMDDSMICHPDLNVCVLTCSTTTECPAAWVCDERPETRAGTAPDDSGNGPAICVNPTCGGSSE
jgi:hypothetical protein